MGVGDAVAVGSRVVVGDAVAVGSGAGVGEAVAVGSGVGVGEGTKVGIGVSVAGLAVEVGTVGGSAGSPPHEMSISPTTIANAHFIVCPARRNTVDWLRSGFLIPASQNLAFCISYSSIAVHRYMAFQLPCPKTLNVPHGSGKCLVPHLLRTFVCWQRERVCNFNRYEVLLLRQTAVARLEVG